MKKLVFLLLSLSIIIGCSNLTDNILGISKKYEGTWICTEGELNGKTVTINSDGSLKYENITISAALITKHSDDHYSASTTFANQTFSVDLVFTSDSSANVEADGKSGVFTKQ
ncbi:hypothetical protein [Brachyspira pilosicoli]|uniref:Lipoprotein n=1 Tax=Brachyspira pilosicoli TaxID=52584 RepID=A0A5C8EQ44_BRAPL|nr:hypothetical protein [Brachyspira pilosicoli]TXJ39453.1 hypothetical protein EPJ72_09945 [Brachyspira pilosicoli]